MLIKHSINFALYVISFVLSLCIHEYFHGVVAVKLGDDTPKEHGRLTLNPLKHISITGSLVFLITKTVGWAKPIPVNMQKLGLKNTGYVAFAGIAANAVIALISANIVVILKMFESHNLYHTYSNLFFYFFTMFWLFTVKINIILFIVNLIPIPPMDGFRVLTGIVSYYNKSYSIDYSKQGYIDLIGLIVFIGLFYFFKDYIEIISLLSKKIYFFLLM